ncbi:MAG TPA: hypothetical protein VN155_15510 [Devosia sp.]|nr:hypothetical protein [Devosia sp.]
MTAAAPCSELERYLFVGAIMHGTARRVNPGQRRMTVYIVMPPMAVDA